jgi:glucose/arabinose dehydrogenase
MTRPDTPAGNRPWLVEAGRRGRRYFMSRVFARWRLLLLVLLGVGCPRPGAADRPGDRYHIRVEDMPPPFATGSAVNPPRVVPGVNGARVEAPRGFRVEVWAEGFRTPRQAAVAPNGDVLVVESGAGRISLLRDADGDGQPELRTTFLEGLSRPFGVKLREGWLYVANETSVVRVPYRVGDERAAAAPEPVVPNLPGGGHWTRDVLFSANGAKMYVSVGSASNVAEEEPRRAAILEFNPDGTGERIYASGLRNPVGIALHPTTGALWTTVNERDGLGDDLPPDYVTSVLDGGFYGWPYAYIGAHPEPRMGGKRPDLVERTIVPDVLIQAHSAPLGLLFYTGDMFPGAYRRDLFVALHGSWNRNRRTGYKVVRVHFGADGRALGSYEDFLTGWSDSPDAREVWGRPVGLAQLRDGSLLVLDDGGDRIWRVTYDPASRVVAHGKLPAAWARVKGIAPLPVFPNPANPEVWAPFVLGVPSAVEVLVFDARGAVVRRIGLGPLASGAYATRDRAAHWDGRDGRGQPVATGVYFVQLRGPAFAGRSQRVVLVR